MSLRGEVFRKMFFGYINRYLAVRFPFRAKSLCTVRRAKMAVLSVLAIHMISHLPYFWRRFDPHGRTLSEKCNYALPSLFITVYEVVRMLVFDTALPCLGTLGFTVAMTSQLRVMMNKKLSEKPQVSGFWQTFCGSNFTISESCMTACLAQWHGVSTVEKGAPHCVVAAQWIISITYYFFSSCLSRALGATELGNHIISKCS